jgi:hypothetical protein
MMFNVTLNNMSVILVEEPDYPEKTTDKHFFYVYN